MVVDPELEELQSLATERRRAATVLRTELEVVLKYSWNLLEEPDIAAVAAVVAKEAQLLESCQG